MKSNTSGGLHFQESWLRDFFETSQFVVFSMYGELPYSVPKAALDLLVSIESSVLESGVVWFFFFLAEPQFSYKPIELGLRSFFKSCFIHSFILTFLSASGIATTVRERVQKHFILLEHFIKSHKFWSEWVAIKSINQSSCSSLHHFHNLERKHAPLNKIFSWKRCYQTPAFWLP